MSVTKISGLVENWRWVSSISTLLFRFQSRDVRSNKYRLPLKKQMTTDETLPRPIVRPSIKVLAISTLAIWFSGLFFPNFWAFVTIAACWIFFGVYVLVRLLQNGHRWLIIMPIVFVIVIAIGVSMPLEMFNSLLDPANRFLATKGSPIAAGKIGHIICFGALTFFMLLHHKKWNLSRPELFVILALIGLATEGVQLFIAGRTPKILDLGFDITGVGLGIILFVLVSILLRYKPVND